MAETSNASVGRILDYQIPDLDEFVTSFKSRVEEQVEVLRIGIKNGSVNDSTISENYAKKVERFLRTPYFLDKKNKKKRVSDLKKHLKLVVAVDKEKISIIDEWLTQKRRNKVILADKFTPTRKKKDFSFYVEMGNFFWADMDFLSTCKTKYSSERIVINRLIGILSDDEIRTQILHYKNQWKVETLKKALKTAKPNLTAISDEEFEEMMALPYFKYKRYLTMECGEFKELIKIRAEALMEIEGWIDEQYLDACHGHDHLYEYNSEIITSGTILDIFKEYDEFITAWSDTKKEFDKEYSLYRFGQGLIEADIFASLYK